MSIRVLSLLGAVAAQERLGYDVMAKDAPPAPPNRVLPFQPADCFVNPTFDPADRQSITDIEYGWAINPFGLVHKNETLKMDVHFPPKSDGRAKRPIVVWVHGGAFVVGDKKDDQQMFNTLVARGYVVASVNYRMVPGDGLLALEKSIEAAVVAGEDTRAAIRYMRMMADEWRLDANRVVVGGDSAGGITADFIGFTKNFTDGESGNPGYDSSVNAVLHISGAMEALAFCETPGEAPDYEPSGCLVDQRQRGGDLTDEMSAGDVPAAMIHGTKDTIVPYITALKMDARATAVGIKHDFITVPGAGHVPYGDIFNEQEPYFKRWLTFLSGSLNLAEAECPSLSIVV
jgi:acetyl esterase/lipase